MERNLLVEGGGRIQQACARDVDMIERQFSVIHSVASHFGTHVFDFYTFARVHVAVTKRNQEPVDS
jgi:hypothetical protein